MKLPAPSCKKYDVLIWRNFQIGGKSKAQRFSVKLMWVNSKSDEFIFSWNQIGLKIDFAYRHVIITPVSLATFGTFPILVPNVVAQRHVAPDFTDTFVFWSAAFWHIILLLGSLKYQTIFTCKKLILKIVLPDSNTELCSIWLWTNSDHVHVRMF